MDREEILKRSRKDNEGRDEMERKVFTGSGQKACAVGGILCAILVMLEGFVCDNFNMGLCAVLMSMCGTMLLFKGIELKQKIKLIGGAVQLLIAAALLVMHIITILR
ncbi:MAG: DUF6442 family protein [Lachnospiraceae bacterium]|nr:DUF6442 family protein [Lachnospiraceae bacterium]